MNYIHKSLVYEILYYDNNKISVIYITNKNNKIYDVDKFNEEYLICDSEDYETFNTVNDLLEYHSIDHNELLYIHKLS